MVLKHLAPVSLWVAVLLYGGTTHRVMAQGAVALTQNAGTNVPSGVVARAVEISQKVAEIKRRTWLERIHQEVREVGKIAELSPDGIKALEALGGRVVEACVKDWEERLSIKYVRIRQRFPEYGAMILDSDLNRLETVAGESLVVGSTGPTEHPLWAEGLGKVLSAAQLARVKDAQSESQQTRYAAIAESLRPWSDKTEKRVRKPLEERVMDLTTLLELSGERAAKLSELVEEVIGQYMNAWMGKVIPPLSFMEEEPRAKVVARVDAVLFEEESALPENQPKWKDGVLRILSAEEMLRVVAFDLERVREEERGIEELLKTSGESVREKVAEGMNGRVEEMTLLLGLSAERTEQLRELREKAVGRAVEVWREDTRRAIQSLGVEQRRGLLRGGRLSTPARGGEMAEQSEVWIQGVASFLSAEERGRLDEAARQAQARRLRIVGQVLLMQMDARVGLSQQQRQSLQPVAERLVEEDKALVSPDGDSHNQYALQKFLAAAARARGEEMERILEPEQWKYWQESCLKKKPRADSALEEDDGAGAKPALKPLENAVKPEPEPEDVENAISDFLARRSAAHRRQVLSGILLRAEEIARVTGLPEEGRRRLRVAAQGAVEESERVWKVQVEQMVRASLRRPDSNNVRQQLAGIQEQIFNQARSGVAVEKQPVWERTLKGELDAEREKVWQEALEQRSLYEAEGISGLLLLELDRVVGLRGDQWKRLEGAVSGMVKDYAIDLARMFSSTDGNAWYLRSHSMFVPLLGVPEAVMKEVLVPSQWQRWAQSSQFEQAQNYWRTVQPLQQQRKLQEQGRKNK
jgi:hypothetical protein